MKSKNPKRPVYIVFFNCVGYTIGHKLIVRYLCFCLAAAEPNDSYILVNLYFWTTKLTLKKSVYHYPRIFICTQNHKKVIVGEIVLLPYVHDNM